jgi:hypothetical protein
MAFMHVILDNVLAGSGATQIGLLQIVNTVAIFLILALALLSHYFSSLRPAKIKAIEIQSQPPLGYAHHTVIFTNYGARTGVIIGPEVVSRGKMSITSDSDTNITPIESKDTVIREVEVFSEEDENHDYHIVYKDSRGKKIALPKHRYYGKPKAK